VFSDETLAFSFQNFVVQISDIKIQRDQSLGSNKEQSSDFRVFRVERSEFIVPTAIDLTVHN
jgi:hypothetical protein